MKINFAVLQILKNAKDAGDLHTSVSKVGYDFIEVGFCATFFKNSRLDFKKFDFCQT